MGLSSYVSKKFDRVSSYVNDYVNRSENIPASLTPRDVNVIGNILSTNKIGSFHNEEYNKDEEYLVTDVVFRQLGLDDEGDREGQALVNFRQKKHDVLKYIKDLGFEFIYTDTDDKATTDIYDLRGDIEHRVGIYLKVPEWDNPIEFALLQQRKESKERFVGYGVKIHNTIMNTYDIPKASKFSKEYLLRSVADNDHKTVVWNLMSDFLKEKKDKDLHIKLRGDAWYKTVGRFFRRGKRKRNICDLIEEGFDTKINSFGQNSPDIKTYEGYKKNIMRKIRAHYGLLHFQELAMPNFGTNSDDEFHVREILSKHFEEEDGKFKVKFGWGNYHNKLRKKWRQKWEKTAHVRVLKSFKDYVGDLDGSNLEKKYWNKAMKRIEADRAYSGNTLRKRSSKAAEHLRVFSKLQEFCGTGNSRDKKLDELLAKFDGLLTIMQTQQGDYSRTNTQLLTEIRNLNRSINQFLLRQPYPQTIPSGGYRDEHNRQRNEFDGRNITFDPGGQEGLEGQGVNLRNTRNTETQSRSGHRNNPVVKKKIPEEIENEDFLDEMKEIAPYMNYYTGIKDGREVEADKRARNYFLEDFDDLSKLNDIFDPSKYEIEVEPEYKVSVLAYYEGLFSEVFGEEGLVRRINVDGVIDNNWLDLIGFAILGHTFEYNSTVALSLFDHLLYKRILVESNTNLSTKQQNLHYSIIDNIFNKFKKPLSFALSRMYRESSKVCKSLKTGPVFEELDRYQHPIHCAMAILQDDDVGEDSKGNSMKVDTNKKKRMDNRLNQSLIDKDLFEPKERVPDPKSEDFTAYYQKIMSSARNKLREGINSCLSNNSYLPPSTNIYSGNAVEKNNVREELKRVRGLTEEIASDIMKGHMKQETDIQDYRNVRVPFFDWFLLKVNTLVSVLNKSEREIFVDWDEAGP